MNRLTIPTLGLAALCASCDDSGSCTLELRSALTGTVRDEAGRDVIPDAVTVRFGNDPARACYIMLPVRFGCPEDRSGECYQHYACPEGRAGHAEVLVSLGDRSWTQPIRIRDEPDGCHNAAQQLDFVLDGVSDCEPAVAVSGSVSGPGGSALPGASISLSRDGDVGPGVSVACKITGQRYECPAISQHATHDYRLVLNVAGVASAVLVRVPAKDCVLMPVRHDFVAR